MRRRLLTIQQPGFGQEHRPGAGRRQRRSARVAALQPVDLLGEPSLQWIARRHRNLRDAHNAGVDATALLWRLRLEGVDVGARFERVADDWAARLEGEAGFYAFSDLHAAMAFAATGREAALSHLLKRMEHAAALEDSNAAMTRDVGLPLARGVSAFAQGRYGAAIASDEPVRDYAHRFGGSHAQRDLITLTLIEAALRSGDVTRARQYIAERITHKRDSRWGARLWARAEHRRAAAQTPDLAEACPPTQAPAATPSGQTVALPD